MNFFVEQVTAEKKNKSLKKKKKRPSGSGKSSASTSKNAVSSTTASAVDPFEAAMKLLEKDSAVLNNLDPELKQQVFYLLLVRGETLCKEKDPKSIDKAVEYFVKAVGLVSQPGEVIMSYEQTLPADIFKRIILELQKQNLEKTRAYFASLASETGFVHFEESDGPKSTSPTANSIKQWTLVASSDLDEGVVLFSEEPDVALNVLSECCDFCFKSLKSLEPEHLADLSYCSNLCLTKARDIYAKHLENLKGTPAYAYQQLVKVVHETKCYAPILMLRYIATLLEDELSRQKRQESAAKDFSLFGHYDYLRPAYRVPRDTDKAEAVLIRTILQPSHADIAQFLSDEIYVAMKSTVMFNALGFKGEEEGNEDLDKAEEAQFVEESEISVNEDTGAKPDALKVLEPVRYSGSTSKSDFFGLYHSFSHISHSCDPNSRLISDPAIPRRLKLVSKRQIKAGEKITISYAPEPDCSKQIIERDFYISCECIKCESN